MKSFLITGSTNGIGKATAQLMLSKDYHVIMVGRNESLMKKTIEAFMLEMPNASIDYFICDFMDFESVRKAAKQIKEKYQAIDYMYFNAGALPPYKNAKTPFGHDFSMSVNFMGPLLFLEELIPLSVGSESKTIIHTTSMSARKKFDKSEMEVLHTYPRIKSYATSKLFANLSFFHYAKRYPMIKFKLIDPGIVYTNVINYVIPKWFRFLAPLGHLITRMPIVVAREVEKVLYATDLVNIAMYKKGKLKKHHEINENEDLQAFVIDYASKHY